MAEYPSIWSSDYNDSCCLISDFFPCVCLILMSATPEEDLKGILMTSSRNFRKLSKNWLDWRGQSLRTRSLFRARLLKLYICKYTNKKSLSIRMMYFEWKGSKVIIMHIKNHVSGFSWTDYWMGPYSMFFEHAITGRFIRYTLLVHVYVYTLFEVRRIMRTLL